MNSDNNKESVKFNELLKFSYNDFTKAKINIDNE